MKNDVEISKYQTGLLCQYTTGLIKAFEEDFLERCIICGSPLYIEEGIAYTDSAGRKGAICESCGTQMNELKDGKGEVKFDIISKLYTGAKTGTTNETESASGVNPQLELENMIRKMKGTDLNTKAEYTPRQTTDIYDTGSSFWITGLKTITWIVFVITLIAGIIAGIQLISDGSTVYGLLAILGTFIVAFLEAAFLMVIANAAQDIEAIRNIMQSRK